MLEFGKGRMVVTDPARAEMETGAEPVHGWDPTVDGPPTPGEMAEMEGGALLAFGDEWTGDGEEGQWVLTQDGERVFRVRTLSAEGPAGGAQESEVAEAGRDENGADQPGRAALMAVSRDEGVGQRNGGDTARARRTKADGGSRSPMARRCRRR